MFEDLCRAVEIKGNKRYEYITFNTGLFNESQYQSLEEKHKFDFCLKHSFETAPFFGAFSLSSPKYGFYIPRYKTVYDRYFSKEMKLEEKLSEKIRNRFEPKKSGKTTSGNEFSSGKFYSAASSSRFAVSSFSKEKNGKLDYIDSIKINKQVEKIIESPEFEYDTPINGIEKGKHCPQLDFFCKTNKGTYFFEVKNHEILDSHKFIELSSSYMNVDSFKKLALNGIPYKRSYLDSKGKDHHYISLVKDDRDKKDFLLATDFGCELKTFHFDFKQFLCHLMGIYSYAMNHKDEQVFFYYLIYKNELYEKEYCSKLYTELEEEIKIVFDVFGKRFPFIHFGLCYNNKYDTLAEIRLVEIKGN